MAGVIELSFERDAGNLVIRCRDDGRGLDLAAIRQRARDQGLIQASDNPADAELARLILQPGFSTRTETTQLSGRGIGLDVVAQSMRDLRGRIDIGFVPGEGTHFLLTVPVRMATIPVMVARAPTHVLALSVREVEQIVAADGLFVDAAGTARCQLGDTVLQAVRLESLLRLPERALWVEGVNEIVLIVRQGAEASVAVVTPELGQTRNVILRPLPGFVPAIAGIEGLAVLGDGAVAPVVDLPELLAHRNDDAPQYASMLTSEANIAPICLVVDDSVSVRRSMELFIRDLGLQVDTAGDGLEALARVNKRRPDLAIVDLEMPRMNGVELTSALRADPQTAQLPIIMITSRFSEKHKQLAQAAGVDVFLTKPYTEDELAAEIQRCLFRAAH